MAPALTFAVCFFCFGLLLSRLGFFQDDWHHVFYAYWQGAEGLQQLLVGRSGSLRLDNLHVLFQGAWVLACFLALVTHAEFVF